MQSLGLGCAPQGAQGVLHCPHKAINAEAGRLGWEQETVGQVGALHQGGGHVTLRKSLCESYNEEGQLNHLPLSPGQEAVT